jgi:hypothetical protein
MLKHATVKPDLLSSRGDTTPVSLGDVFVDHDVVKKEYSTQNQSHDDITGRSEDTVADYKVIAHSSDAATEKVYRINGLVGAAIKAYNEHHGLVLRPDDVWQAIATQFALYVAGNAETLRPRFVDHEGQKELKVYGRGSLHSADYEMLAKAMSDEIVKNIKNPLVTAWLMPEFSTTTKTDRVTAAVTVMATMKEYFSFKFCLRCGLPSVELLGTVEDWEKLLDKTQRLREFDVDGNMKKWQAMLEPIIAEMIETKKGKDNMDWWQKIAHYKGGGSGPTYISGWITAFAVFTEKGRWQGDMKQLSLYHGGETVEYCLIDTNDLPPTVVTCPLTVDDNGTEYKCKLFAGQFCFTSKTGIDIRPRNDWCLTAEA